MKWKLYEDGRWDVAGKSIQLRGAYPAVNGEKLSPIGVRQEENVLIYRLKEGIFKLEFRETEDGIAVRGTAQGIPGIHDLEPIAGAKTEQVQNVFVQGFGMDGKSGCMDVGDKRCESNGLIALYNEETVLLVYALEHKQYINRYCTSTGRELFSQNTTRFFGGFNLEGTGKECVILPEIYFTETQELVSGLKACAEKIAACMGARKSKRPAFYWCSWYYLYQNLNQELLKEYVTNFRKEGIPFSHIQIDAGYAAALGDWLRPSHHFLQGLKKAARTILDAGYEPGIWIGPFMVGDQSELFRDHPDWILHDLAGNPVTELRSYCEPKLWGSRDGNYYVLDASHPQALAYLKKVFTTLKEWGFTLFKTDFMLWNMHDTARVRRYDNNMTSVEILRNTLKTIREAIGEDSYLLGCIAPFLPFLGYADGMRIAGDVGARWSEEFGPVKMIRVLAVDHYFNHIYWQNDPDSVLLREFDTELKPHEIRSLALLQALSGGVITTSDPLHQIGREQKKLLEFITPRQAVNPQYPYFGQKREEIVLFHELAEGNLLFFMNPTEKSLTVYCNFAEIFSNGEWYVRRYGVAGCAKCDHYLDVLGPHDSALLFLTKDRQEEAPANLWQWQETKRL